MYSLYSESSSSDYRRAVLLDNTSNPRHKYRDQRGAWSSELLFDLFICATGGCFHKEHVQPHAQKPTSAPPDKLPRVPDCSAAPSTELCLRSLITNNRDNLNKLSKLEMAAPAHKVKRRSAFSLLHSRPAGCARRRSARPREQSSLATRAIYSCGWCVSLTPADPPPGCDMPRQHCQRGAAAAQQLTRLAGCST